MRQRLALAACTLAFAGSITGFAVSATGSGDGAAGPPPAGAAAAAAQDERPDGVVAQVRGRACERERT